MILWVNSRRNWNSTLDLCPLSVASRTVADKSGARCSGSHGDQVSGHTPVADRLPSANGQGSGVQLPLVITQAHEHRPITRM